MSKSYIVGCLFRSLLTAYIVTGFCLLGLSFALYRLDLNENAVSFGIVFIYIFACAIGGILAGKGIKNHKFIWGLCVGLLYVAIIFVMAFVMKQGEPNLIRQNGLSTILLCACAGTFGGMIS